MILRIQPDEGIALHFAAKRPGPTVTLGNAGLPVLFSGLVPGEVAVYVINVLVPRGVASASQTSLTIKQGDFSTTLQVRVVNP